MFGRIVVATNDGSHYLETIARFLLKKLADRGWPLLQLRRNACLVLPADLPKKLIEIVDHLNASHFCPSSGQTAIVFKFSLPTSTVAPIMPATSISMNPSGLRLPV